MWGKWKPSVEKGGKDQSACKQISCQRNWKDFNEETAVGDSCPSFCIKAICLQTSSRLRFLASPLFQTQDGLFDHIITEGKKNPSGAGSTRKLFSGICLYVTGFTYHTKFKTSISIHGFLFFFFLSPVTHVESTLLGKMALSQAGEKQTPSHSSLLYSAFMWEIHERIKYNSEKLLLDLE